MLRLLKAFAITLAFFSVAVLCLVIVGQVSAQSDLGSVLRTAAGGLLAGLTLAWVLYLKRLFRSDRESRNRSTPE
ncbi:hypothetical protein [Streptomyces sp. NPDC059575]|uniref:hypothetical protein n=1 Tax=Streptomyces sp. NPDC059575 TaxID=3346872 RepID=UPI0036820C71